MATNEESVPITPTTDLQPVPSAPDLSTSAAPENEKGVAMSLAMGDSKPSSIEPPAEQSTPHPGIRVLIAIDGSPQSNQAVEWYAKYLHNPANEVILAHSSSVKVPDYNASPNLMKEIMFKAQAECSEIGRLANEIMGKYGASGKFSTLLGKTAESIVEAVADRHVNMVIIGKRHISKLKKKISGSVSSYVISHAHVPVLVCPAPKSQKSSKSK